MESGKCKHCGGPIVMVTANDPWKHWGTFLELCFPAPVAEPIRDDSGAPEPERPQEIPHRWSVKSEDGQTYICRGEHEKSAGCEWEPWPPKPPEPDVPEAVDPIEFLFAELLDLTETLLPHEADKLGHIRQELERHRRGLRGK